MKKSTFIFLLLVGLILIMVSCKDDKEIYVPNEIKFVIGIENDLVIPVDPDKTIEGNYGDYNYEIDIDKDGIKDINFESYSMTSSGGIREKGSIIEVLDSSLELSSIKMIDTTFIWTYHAGDTFSYTIFYNNYSGYTCPSYGNDSISCINEFTYPKIHSLGDTITGNEYWARNCCFISYEDKSSFSDHNYWSKTWKIFRGNWDDISMKYILLRKKIENQFYYGWILLDTPYPGKMHLHQYAIQKE
ncbi:MAG: hypothetical protein K9H64_16500 [Bacteroidales bacterium]|nr:hypothetical protein [Bacteroidales bacterium]